MPAASTRLWASILAVAVVMQPTIRQGAPTSSGQPSMVFTGRQNNDHLASSLASPYGAAVERACAIRHGNGKRGGGAVDGRLLAVAIDALCGWRRAGGAAPAVVEIVAGIDAGRTTELEGSIARADAGARIARRARSVHADVVAGSAVVGVVIEVNARIVAALNVGGGAGAAVVVADAGADFAGWGGAVLVGGALNAAPAAVVEVSREIDALQSCIGVAVRLRDLVAAVAAAQNALKSARALHTLAARAATTVSRIALRIGADRCSRVTDRAGGQVALPQIPPRQLSPIRQTTPHAPQLSLSSCAFVQNGSPASSRQSA